MHGFLELKCTELIYSITEYIFVCFEFISGVIESRTPELGRLQPLYQISMTKLSSFLNLLHLFKASVISWQPFSKEAYFLAKPSAISHPLVCHGSFHTKTPVSFKSLQSSNNPPNQISTQIITINLMGYQHGSTPHFGPGSIYI